ncbi:hypothetical protein IW262DRAFT_869880 [Armillaria fumosa]|nr:hypothetical protein IW262DRAFT_869880 [Armillaria fumosa]
MGARVICWFLLVHCPPCAESDVPALTLLWHTDRQRLGWTCRLSKVLVLSTDRTLPTPHAIRIGHIYSTTASSLCDQCNLPTGSEPLTCKTKSSNGLNYGSLLDERVAHPDVTHSRHMHQEGIEPPADR